MQLPTKITFELMLTKWASILNPLLANPLNQMQMLENVELTSGVTNQVAHKLGRIPRGFITIDVQEPAICYRVAPSDINFLYLDCTSDMTASLGVF